MGILAWLRGRMSANYRARWLYRRGTLLAKAHRHQAAIDDYTEVINMPDAAANVRAMAYYNRALAYHTSGNQDLAVADLREVLHSADAAEHVKTEARRKLLRIDRTSARNADVQSGAQQNVRK